MKINILEKYKILFACRKNVEFIFFENNEFIKIIDELCFVICFLLIKQ